MSGPPIPPTLRLRAAGVYRPAKDMPTPKEGATAMVPLAGLVSMRKAVNRAELAGALSGVQARDERERLDVGIRTLRETGLEGIRIKIVEPYRLFEETRKVERRAKKKSRRAAKLARRRSRGR